MTDDKKVGRPRIYADDSEKLKAHRTASTNGGYLRKELMVPQGSASLLAQAAQQLGTSEAALASAILQEKLQEFSTNGVPVLNVTSQFLKSRTKKNDQPK